MDIACSELSTREAYALMTHCIIPRPVAWVSSVSADGVRNLAPFSYFVGVGSKPPMLAVSVAHRKGQPKDTGDNIRSLREFVVNICPANLAEKMVMTSGEYSADVDEFELAGLTAVESKIVRVPSVAESPIRMECKLDQIVQPGGNPTDLILGEIVHFHIDDDILTDGMPDPAKLAPIARLGGQSYATLGKIFDIARPS